MPETARERVTNPPAGTASCFAFGYASRKRPSISKTALMYRYR